MDLKTAIDIIIKDLRESCDIIDDLKKYPGVPVWQVELAKSKCKSAGELIALLKELQDSDKITNGPNQVSVEKAAQENPPAEQKKEPAEVMYGENKTIPPEVLSQEVKSNPPADQTLVAKEEPGLNGKKLFESATIADQFSNRPSYNEQLGGHMHEGDVFEKMKTAPVSNLAEAIGLNDKFLFIREIFNGSQEKYNQAISSIDSVTNLQEAREIIMGYAGDATDKEAVKQFIDLVKRKFPSHE